MLKIVGFGSGAKDNMTLEASAAISSAQLIVGYSTYVDILKQYFPVCHRHGKERQGCSTCMQWRQWRIWHGESGI